MPGRSVSSAASAGGTPPLEPLLPSGLDAAWVTIGLDALEAALAAVPPRRGVGQLLAPGERNLVIGRAANLRRWAAAHLGAGPPPRPGRRPPIDLRPVAASLRFAAGTSEFHQRLLYERRMAAYVPVSARRDLKPTAWLRLDPDERFPRVIVRSGRVLKETAAQFGPFASAAAAARARDALHKAFPLRPCDFVFEPHPELPLGLGCVFAQTRTCAAPCLQRVGEPEYRELAARAAGVLAEAATRPAEWREWLPEWVSSRAAHGLVVESGTRGIELYPVRMGRVLEAQAVRCAPAALREAIAAVRWEATDAAAEPDWPWLSAWLHAPRRQGRYVMVQPDEPPSVLAARLL